MALLFVKMSIRESQYKAILQKSASLDKIVAEQKKYIKQLESDHRELVGSHKELWKEYKEVLKALGETGITVRKRPAPE